MKKPTQLLSLLILALLFSTQAFAQKSGGETQFVFGTTSYFEAKVNSTLATSNQFPPVPNSVKNGTLKNGFTNNANQMFEAGNTLVSELNSLGKLNPVLARQASQLNSTLQLSSEYYARLLKSGGKDVKSQIAFRKRMQDLKNLAQDIRVEVQTMKNER